MFNANLLFCINHKYNEDYEGVIHSHPCYELVYYKEGSGSIMIDNQKSKFEKDKFMICWPNEKHLETGSVNTEVLYIGFEADCNEIPHGVFSEEQYGVFEYLEKIYYESKHWSKYSYELIRLFTEIIIIKLINKNVKGNTEKEPINRAIDNIAGYISVNFNKNLNVRELAMQAGYSYDHFRKIFKKYLGISVNDYILNKRIKAAHEMLLTEKYYLKQIAVDCGFNSVAHFCTKYKEVMGDTPTNVLNKIKNGEEIEVNLFIPS